MTTTTATATRDHHGAPLLHRHPSSRTVRPPPLAMTTRRHHAPRHAPPAAGPDDGTRSPILAAHHGSPGRSKPATAARYRQGDGDRGRQQERRHDKFRRHRIRRRRSTRPPRTRRGRRPHLHQCDERRDVVRSSTSPRAEHRAATPRATHRLRRRVEPRTPRSRHEDGVRAVAKNYANFDEALLPMVLASGVSGEAAASVAEAIMGNPALKAQAERAFQRARTQRRLIATPTLDTARFPRRRRHRDTSQPRASRSAPLHARGGGDARGDERRAPTPAPSSGERRVPGGGRNAVEHRAATDGRSSDRTWLARSPCERAASGHRPEAPMPPRRPTRVGRPVPDGSAGPRGVPVSGARRRRRRLPRERRGRRRWRAAAPAPARRRRVRESSPAAA